MNWVAKGGVYNRLKAMGFHNLRKRPSSSLLISAAWNALRMICCSLEVMLLFFFGRYKEVSKPLKFLYL